MSARYGTFGIGAHDGYARDWLESRLRFSAAKATPTKSTKPTCMGWKSPKGDFVTLVAANSFAQKSERNNAMPYQGLLTVPN